MAENTERKADHPPTQHTTSSPRSVDLSINIRANLADFFQRDMSEAMQVQKAALIHVKKLRKAPPGIECR